MYGYENDINITPDQVLQKITQEQIFEFVLKQQFNFSDRYLSPFRIDHKPGCRFEQRADGAILFVDFGEKFLHPAKTHRSAFGIVMDKYNVSLTGAIKILIKQFNLSSDLSTYRQTDEIAPYQRSEKIITKINYEKKALNRADIWFWSQSLIRPEHLIEDHVFAASKFSIFKDGKLKIINIYKYCYVIDFIDKVKIYQPYSERYKWITNCDENNIGNIDNLPATGDELIIQKSYKDHRILRNLEWGLNVIWFQNEGCVPSLEILKNLTDRFKLISIFFDNDKDGILAGNKLSEIFNNLRPGCARMIYLPYIEAHMKLHGHYLKDPGEYIHKEGRSDLITVLKQIDICQRG